MRRLAEAFALTGEEQATFEAAAQPAPHRRGHEGAGTPPAPRIHNLPVELSSFIGRDQELGELTRLLGATRLVTLVGPGGVGKTRLALAVAAARAGEYADGVAFVDLSPLRDQRLVPATIAHTLEVRPAGGRTARELLLAYLRERQLLLVLDNFEHLLGAAPILTELLHTCPRVAVLVTSRTALRIRGEQRFAVLPLATPPAGSTITDQDLIGSPAVRLFVQRAQGLIADFALTASTAPAVASICRRVDGLPLAIELAAARVPLLSPDALLRRLDRGLLVLTSGAPDLPERQQTLRNTLVWSHDLLEPADRLLFRRLAVFAGGWTLEAAEAVCADAELSAHELLDGLQSLVDHSLVRRLGQAGSEPRFGMLETIREYAVEQLEVDSEASIMRERHLSWCLAYAESAESELRGPRQQDVLAQLELEHDNMRSALSWSLLRPSADGLAADAALRLGGALARFWSVRGLIVEGRAWLERAIEAADAKPLVPSQQSTAARARALLGLGWLCAAHGDFSRALEHQEASLALYRGLGDERGMAAPLLAMAHLADYQGKSQQVRALLLDSIEHARAGSDDNQVGEALCWLARALYQGSELASARVALKESATLLSRTGDLARLAGTLFVQGVIEAEQGDHFAAETALARSSEVYRQAGDRVGETKALGWLGYVSLHAGDYPAARTCLSECVARGHHDGLNELPKWLCLLAALDRTEGRAHDAWTRARESLALYQRIGCPAPAVRALEVASGLLAATRRPANVELAARLFGAAEAKRLGSGLPLVPAECADYERDVALVRSQLPADVAARAWKQGHTMSLEDAIAEALAV
jgi:predicted ATPase